MTSTATTGGRARPLPPEERRAVLVAATLPLVVKHGAKVTTKQIAEAAGVAEGTIFRVFPDKEALVRAAVADRRSTRLPTVAELGGIDLGPAAARAAGRRSIDDPAAPARSASST